eukprot:2934864-Pyramimonas_sp.AAC.1
MLRAVGRDSAQIGGANDALKGARVRGLEAQRPRAAYEAPRQPQDASGGSDHLLAVLELVDDGGQAQLGAHPQDVVCAEGDRNACDGVLRVIVDVAALVEAEP